MSVTAMRLEHATPSARVHVPTVQAVDDATCAHASPAKELQDELEARLAEKHEVSILRWPGAVRLLFILGGSGMGWAGLLALVKIAISSAHP